MTSSPTAQPFAKAKPRAWHRTLRRLWRWTLLVFTGLVALIWAPSWAQTVTLGGGMGTRALLVIDGQPRAVPVGGSVQGVKLLSFENGVAKVDVGGQIQTLSLTGGPVALSSATDPNNRQIVLTAGLGGHFIATGAINNRATQFMVDTGASSVAISQSEADRLGVNYRNGQRIATSTANGTVPAHRVNLASIRIGEVDVMNVDAVVVPSEMPYVLLGNSYLSRFQMTRDNDTLKLEKH